MKLFYSFLIILLIIPLVSAATIKGSAYDLSFNQLTTATISINTTPTQTKVINSGDYVFIVPLGKYKLHLKQYNYDQVIAEINQTIEVKTDGEFILDLIAYPVIDFENLDSIDMDLEEELIPESEQYSISSFLIRLMYVVIGIFIIIIIYVFIRKDVEKDISKIDEIEDDLENKILDFIKIEKTTSQLIVRNKFPQYSEAKISLIIKKLEAENKIKKYKKGRANIVSIK